MKTRTSLVAIKFHRGDYAGASASLDEIITFYGSTGWEIIETTLLVVQAKCQQQLGHKEEYLKVILRLLEKSALAERLRLDVRTNVIGRVEEIEGVDVKDYVNEVATLAQEITTPQDFDLRMICDRVNVERFPVHAEGRDGYTLNLNLWYLLEEPMVVEKAVVRMVDVAGLSKDVILEVGETTLKKGECVIGLRTNVRVPFLPTLLVTNGNRRRYWAPSLPLQSN